MKKTIFSLIATGVAGLWVSASAQPVPGDYFSFTRLISDRNIFDPSRQHNRSMPNSYGNQLQLPLQGTPVMRLVGTMSYEKGMFAFFDGNSRDLGKVLQVGDKAQGYTITEITARSVGLESANKTGPLQLKIGGGLRQENGQWVISDNSDLPDGTRGLEAAGLSNNDSTSATAGLPAPANGENDILKRLMEQRAKENQ
jgi:hypothetical protein